MSVGSLSFSKHFREVNSRVFGISLTFLILKRAFSTQSFLILLPLIYIYKTEVKCDKMQLFSKFFYFILFFFIFKDNSRKCVPSKIPFGSPMYKMKAELFQLLGG